MIKTYVFRSRGWDWKLFVDSFGATLSQYPQLSHIRWGYEYTGGIGKLIIDYGETWTKDYCRWCRKPLDDRWTDCCSTCSNTFERMLQG